MIVILALGIIACLLGGAMLALPGRLGAFEQRVNSARANAAIPGFWHGRMNARMRFAGAIMLVCGVLIIIAAFVGSHHR